MSVATARENEWPLFNIRWSYAFILFVAPLTIVGAQEFGGLMGGVYGFVSGLTAVTFLSTLWWSLMSDHYLATAFNILVLCVTGLLSMMLLGGIIGMALEIIGIEITVEVTR